MTVYEMALKYYPLYWDKARLRKLVAAAKLSSDEYKQITEEDYI